VSAHGFFHSHARASARLVTLIVLLWICLFPIWMCPRLLSGINSNIQSFQNNLGGSDHYHIPAGSYYNAKLHNSWRSILNFQCCEANENITLFGSRIFKKFLEVCQIHPSSPAEHKIHIVEKLQSATVT